MCGIYGEIVLNGGTPNEAIVRAMGANKAQLEPLSMGHPSKVMLRILALSTDASIAFTDPAT